MRIGVVLVLLVAGLAGCLDDGSKPMPEDPSPPDVPSKPPLGETERVTPPAVPVVPDLPPGVVVADVSAGVNVYHEAFRRPSWTHHPSDVIRGFPSDAPALELTFGDDYEANLAADADAWANYQLDRIHWIPGTNLLVWTIEEYDTIASGHGHPFHGSATAGAVNDGCNECYILVVQHSNNWDGSALRELAQLPWVDFVQSTVFHGGTAFPGGSRNHARASLELHTNGSLYFAPSGNQVVNGMLNGFMLTDWSWPAWVVNVGGAHERCGAAELTSGQYPEFTNDYVQFLPSAGTTTGTQPTAGTSFSTPLSAGRFGKALWLIRQELGYGEGGRWSGEPQTGFGLEDGVLTAEEMREAFAAAAFYFAPTDYQNPGGCLVLNAPAPISPTPWIQQGWGHIGTGTSEVVADAILGRGELPTKGPEVHAWMEALMTARELRYQVL